MTIPASIGRAVVLAAPDRAAWLALRGIGGSDVAAIRGHSPFASPWDVWVRRQPGVAQDRDDADPILAEGLRFEPMIAAEYALATGRTVTRHVNVVVQHPEFPWATGSPDGTVVDPEAGLGGADWKTYRMRDAAWGPSGSVVEAFGPEAVAVSPLYYLDQAYWYLEITGLPWWDLVVWLPRSFGFPELRWIRVMADRPHQRRMLLEVARWRQRHLVEGVQPDVDGSDACKRWQAPAKATKKTTRPATDAEVDLVARLQWARRVRDEHDRIARQTENELGALFGPDTYGVRMAGLKCLRVRAKGRASVDLDAVRKHLPSAVTDGAEFVRFNLYPVKE